MTEQQQPNPEHDPIYEDHAIEEMPVESPRREASLTLRTDDAREERAASMEAANRSLADALRITYVLLQVVMVALVAMYFLSGFQQVNEAEAGLKVRFGQIDESTLEPGFVFSWPYPIGELIKVDTSQQSVELNEADSFWPYVREDRRGRAYSELGNGGPLSPERDGSMLTGDGNLVHTQWSVSYRRADPRRYVQNVYQPEEKAIVKAMVQRAAVRVVGEMTFDELISRGGLGADAQSNELTAQTGRRDVERRVRQIAQEGLDAIESGLDIDSVQLVQVQPPLQTYRNFTRVNETISVAEQKRQKAALDAEVTLTRVAGSAYQPLLALIEEYGAALDLGEEDRATAILERMNGILDERLVGALSFEDLGAGAYRNVQLGGEVYSMISRAKEDASTIGKKAEAESRRYLAMLGEYRANPSVFLVREWTDAMSRFRGRPMVEAFVMPMGTVFRLNINTDPDIAKEIQRQQHQRRLEESWEYRQGMQAGEL